MGYIDSFFKRAFRLTLKDQAIADRALADKPEAYRTLDTAVLEALILTGPLGLTRGRHLPSATASATRAPTRRRSTSSSRATTTRRSSCARPPSSRFSEWPQTGINMPPKSTYFYPKVPTGLLFNPLL